MALGCYFLSLPPRMHSLIQPIGALLRKEVASFFNSLIAYVVWGVFLLGIGLYFWLFPGNVLQSGLAEMDTLFSYGPLFLLLLMPAITMRSIADEVRSGTLELLLTRPISIRQLILGKYLASVVLLLLTLLPTLVYVGTLLYLGNPPSNLDGGATLGAYLGLFAVGCVFAAIGICCSALTENTIVAFILAAFICYFLYAGFDLLAELPTLTSIGTLLLQFGLHEHYQSISRGVVDTRDVLYFLSAIVLFLGLSEVTLDRRR